MTPDQINGAFEVVGAVLIACSCVRLYRDKETKGICLSQPLFFTGWGCWNLYFYPAIGQPWSFAGGLAMVATNAIWWAMMIYYRLSNGVENAGRKGSIGRATREQSPRVGAQVS